jgi:hypothetical protein
MEMQQMMELLLKEFRTIREEEEANRNKDIEEMEANRRKDKADFLAKLESSQDKKKR